jgi:hypothetical protein
MDVEAIHINAKPAGEKNDYHVQVTMNNQDAPLHFLRTLQSKRKTYLQSPQRKENNSDRNLDHLNDSHKL